MTDYSYPGRPRAHKAVRRDGQTVTFRAFPDDVAKLDALVDKRYRSRSQAILRLIDDAYKELKSTKN